MANIFLNHVCNLSCGYCFANRLAKPKRQHMKLEDFRKAADFIARDDEQIGIMGGEPTLHPQIDAILEYLCETDAIQDVIYFTNGILIDKYLDLLSRTKIKVLINCNSPDVIGENNYRRLSENIRKSIEIYGMKSRICLGLNIYSPNIDYRYIVDMLKEFGFDFLRLSISAPNFEITEEYNALQYFFSMKSVTMRVIRDALNVGAVPVFDCNKPPICWLTKKERISIFELMCGRVSNVILSESNCYPIVDILSDLSAVRCMGFSNGPVVKIEDFSSLGALRDYFISHVDIPYSTKTIDQRCNLCKFHMRQICNPGCLVYKTRLVNEVPSQPAPGL